MYWIWLNKLLYVIDTMYVVCLIQIYCMCASSTLSHMWLKLNNCWRQPLTLLSTCTDHGSKFYRWICNIEIYAILSLPTWKHCIYKRTMTTNLIHLRSSRWAPVLHPKSKTLFEPVNFFSFYLELYNNKFKEFILGH